MIGSSQSAHQQPVLAAAPRLLPRRHWALLPGVEAASQGRGQPGHSEGFSFSESHTASPCCPCPAAAPLHGPMTPASCPGVLISLPLLLGAASLSQAQQRLAQRGRVLLQCSAIPCLWLSPLPHSHQPSPFFRTHSSPCLLNHFFPFWYFFFL